MAAFAPTNHHGELVATSRGRGTGPERSWLPLLILPHSDEYEEEGLMVKTRRKPEEEVGEAVIEEISLQLDKTAFRKTRFLAL
eukprot:5553896-Amphidinium_carterae.1